jgi:hypothetical protein
MYTVLQAREKKNPSECTFEGTGVFSSEQMLSDQICNGPPSFRGDLEHNEVFTVRIYRF